MQGQGTRRRNHTLTNARLAAPREETVQTGLQAIEMAGGGRAKQRFTEAKSQKRMKLYTKVLLMQPDGYLRLLVYADEVGTIQGGGNPESRSGLPWRAERLQVSGVRRSYGRHAA